MHLGSWAFLKLFLNEPSPKDGFVHENHVVSFAMPLIFKILGSEAQSKTQENKTSEEPDGKHPPGSLCWMKTTSSIFLTRFVLFGFFFPLVWRNPCVVWVCEEDFPFMRCHKHWDQLRHSSERILDVIVCELVPAFFRGGTNWLCFSSTSALTEPVSFNH